jgi:Ni,Fe-hydrogenase III small subunit
MIFDVPKRSLLSPNAVVPVQELIGHSQGSRMPDVNPALLTGAIARRVVDSCCTSALALHDTSSRFELTLDYGECIGCGRCGEVSEGAFFPAEKFIHCGVSKQGLIRRWDIERRTEIIADEELMTATAQKIRAIVGGALNIREVDGGSCNGCEAEIIAASNPYYDLERFGIHFVASPKHADMLLVTGPVTRNIAEAVKNAYEATPSPKLVVAVGTCGCSGGIFAGSHAVKGGVDSVIPVDAYIPGCPPTPAMILTGILRALRRHS